MVDDDNPPEGHHDSESEIVDFGAPAGPRRSTWAPSASTNLNDSTDMSDDDLARALEVDFERATHTGVLPVVNSFVPDHTPDAPIPMAPAPVAPAPEAHAPVTPEAVFPQSPGFESIVPERPTPIPVASEPVLPEPIAPAAEFPGPLRSERLNPDVVVSEPSKVHSLDDVPLDDDYLHPPQQTFVQQNPPANPNPWAEVVEEPQMAPAFVPPPVPIDVQIDAPIDVPIDAPNGPPVRRSIPTSELAATLARQAEGNDEPADIMAQLEDQLRLREHDVSEFRRWQESMVADGGPDALADIDAARLNFGDIMDAPVASSSTAPLDATVENISPVLATHTFRVDEVLDSDLLNLPAPMTAPVSDIPPPSDNASGTFTLPGTVLPPAPVNPTPITMSTLPVPPTFDEAPREFSDSTPTPTPFSAPETGVAPEVETESRVEQEPEAERELFSPDEHDLDLETQLGFGTADTEAPRIPDLVEPSVAAAHDPFDFDALIGGATSAVDDVPTAFSFNDVVETAPEVFSAAVPVPVSGPEAEPLLQPEPGPVPEPLVASGSPLSDDVVPDTDVDDPDVDDPDVDDSDHVFADLLGPFPVTSEGVTIVPEPLVVPFDPIVSAPAPSGQNPVVEAKLTGPPVFRVEEVSAEPTPTDQRVGRASRLFWLWFAANSSVVSVAFGGAVLSLGMSLRQAIVATLIGVAVSFLPLGLGTLAGKWSGQPTMIVSRATFGHLGNIFPSVLAIIVRVFWGAVLLWFLAAGTARILVGAELTGPLTEIQVMIIGLALGFLLALVIAFFGYGLIARVQMVFTIVSAALIVGLIAITWPAVDIPMALTVGDGPWILVVTGAVLVFSFVGLVWAVSSADLARYQRVAGSGAASMLWSTFGATIPAFVLIAYGAVLAASDPAVATGLLDTPLDTIALLIPTWYPVPLIAALAFSLLSGVVISIYSGGFALQATGASMRRPAAVVIVGAGVAVVAGIIAFTVGDFSLILRDVATTLAVPIAAWAGIFGAEMMIRSKRFSPQALLQRGGVYSDFRWVNLGMLLVASAIGFGLTTATVAWLGWQGYLFSVLGVPLSSDLAASDLGVFVALVIGILTPIIVGIPAIRKQEGASIEQPLLGAH